MRRRSLFSNLRYVAAAAWAGLAGYPVARFLGTPVIDESAASDDVPYRRVERLARLKSGVAAVATVVGDKTDAWTVRRDVPIGRVFLRLENDPPADAPESAEIVAYNTICPHSGCQVTRSEQEGRAFYCGCHDGRFEADGGLVEVPGYTNPSPRGLDELATRVEVDESTGEAWVAVAFQDFVIGTAAKLPRA